MQKKVALILFLIFITSVCTAKLHNEYKWQYNAAIAVLDSNLNLTRSCNYKNDSVVVVADSILFDSITDFHSIRKESLVLRPNSMLNKEYIRDSIRIIIRAARKITCVLEKQNPVDTLRKDSVRVLSRKLNSIVKFLVLDPDNFNSNDIVYGMFQSDVCYILKASRNRFVQIHIDFGLRKWKLTDSKNREICTFDMKTTSMQFLRLTRLFFPEDRTLDLLYNNLKIK